jgi:hypothetical protein
MSWDNLAQWFADASITKLAGTGTALLIGLGIIAGVTIGIIRERRRP